MPSVPVEPGTPKRKYLVYTSAGDHANLCGWLKGDRTFDLWITYYGQDGDRFRSVADLYNRRHGSKFQNLHHAYQTWPSLFEGYAAVMVMDDDIVITGSAISRLFDIRQERDLWVLQPAFHPRGKNSHPITVAHAGLFLRYTNFVEMGCPLFRKDKLDSFMRVYDPVLSGFGMDWWFLDVMGEDLRGKVAIIDAITCVNPHDFTKGGLRQMDQLQALADRVAAWQEIKKRYGIRSEGRGQIEFEAIPKPIGSRLLARLLSYLDASPALTRRWIWVLHKAKRVRARLAARSRKSQFPLD